MNVWSDGAQKGGRKGEGMIQQWPCRLTLGKSKGGRREGKEEVTGSRAALKWGMMEVVVLRKAAAV